jgi:hypothetical protein
MAAYRGIKSGNPLALVAVGETSNRGRNKPIPGVSGSVAPATFAYQLSRVAPKLPFDAFATHPYPTNPFLGPTQKVAWPNVTLTRITQFGKSLEQWFHRRVPIWITEYGEQTRPEYSLGVSHAKQASDAKVAMQMAADSPYVEMFVWFTIRDSPATWQSGLFKAGGSKKPSYAAFSSVSKTITGQSQLIAPGKSPTVKVYVPFLAYHDARGTTVAVTSKVYDGKKLVAAQFDNKKLAVDQSVTVTIRFKPVHGKTYRMVADASDVHAQHDERTIVLTTT